MSEPRGAPMWVVARGDARVWIFGETVGLRDDEWVTDQIRDAVATSRVMWCETDRERVEASPSLPTHVLGDVPLRDRLSARQRDALAEVAASLEVDLTILDALRPWAAGQALEGALRERAAADARFGVDAVLMAIASAAGVPQQFEFGDAEETLRWFADMDAELGPDYLMWTVERVLKGQAEIDRQVAAWADGDLSVVEAQDAEFRRDHPNLYERMIGQRNRAWVPRIQELIDGGGSSFVLVGGAHLVGDDSVLLLLHRAGMEPARVA